MAKFIKTSVPKLDLKIFNDSTLPAIEELTTHPTIPANSKLTTGIAVAPTTALVDRVIVIPV